MWRIADRHAKRRKLLVGVTVVVLLAGGGIAYAVVKTSDKATPAALHKTSPTTGTPGSTDPTVAEGSGTSTTTPTTAVSTTTTTTAPAVVSDPFTSSAMSSFLATRQGDITAALFDEENGQTYLYRPGVAEQTASVVKVDILATLLWDLQQQHQVPDDTQTDEATDMIEQSDNDDATDLWNMDGGAPGVAHFDSVAGLTGIDPNVNWGETLTTALDQVELLKLVVYPNSILDSASQSFELHLMENVISYDYWGVSSGPTSGVTVALKNGWVPITGNNNWQINSVGFVDGAGRQYLLAVLTSGDGTEDYGINTIQGVSSIVWSELAGSKG